MQPEAPLWFDHHANAATVDCFCGVRGVCSLCSMASCGTILAGEDHTKRAPPEEGHITWIPIGSFTMMSMLLSAMQKPAATGSVAMAQWRDARKSKAMDQSVRGRRSFSSSEFADVQFRIAVTVGADKTAKGAEGAGT
ncbi:unnamed protein product [Peronospora destructor]|uniref:Uncharacterized protein n=1 Tax=Peronospora destructor TaxID=86335 RepID=A0AAV0TTF7_9STRA|nr:unnamed protein product [Peronospora destructor]